MTEKIDIIGVDKEELLFALWEKSKVAAFFTLSGIPPPPYDKELAKSELSSFIDYFCGRVIKTDLRLDFVSPRMYDRDNGEGAFQAVVDNLRTRC
jgi:hypothetical protein